jgi:hypothetical protein
VADNSVPSEQVFVHAMRPFNVGIKVAQLSKTMYVTCVVLLELCSFENKIYIH